MNKRRSGKKEEEGGLWKKGSSKKSGMCEQKVWKEGGSGRVVEKRVFKEEEEV